jgi:hypothetical protein
MTKGRRSAECPARPGILDAGRATALMSEVKESSPAASAHHGGDRACLAAVEAPHFCADLP